MKISELKSLSKEELRFLLQNKKEGLKNFYFNSSKGKIKNVKEAKNLKKDVARILTIIKNL